MNYVLAVCSPVYATQGAFLAHQFAEAVLAKGHTITQVFFFQDGVTNGTGLVDCPSDEFDLVEHWKKLAKLHGLSLHLCISAAARRGVVENNLAEGFILAGLGEFSKAVFEADRLITF